MQVTPQVGDQTGRQKIAQPRLGEEVQRGVVPVEQLGLDGLPARPALVGLDRYAGSPELKLLSGI